MFTFYNNNDEAPIILSSSHCFDCSCTWPHTTPQSRVSIIAVPLLKCMGLLFTNQWVSPSLSSPNSLMLYKVSNSSTSSLSLSAGTVGLTKWHLTWSEVRVFMSLGFHAWIKIKPGILRWGHQAPRNCFIKSKADRIWFLFFKMQKMKFVTQTVLFELSICDDDFSFCCIIRGKKIIVGDFMKQFTVFLLSTSTHLGKISL